MRYESIHDVFSIRVRNMMEQDIIFYLIIVYRYAQLIVHRQEVQFVSFTSEFLINIILILVTLLLSAFQRDTTGLTTENRELKLRLQSMEQQAHLRDGKFNNFSSLFFVHLFDSGGNVLLTSDT